MNLEAWIKRRDELQAEYDRLSMRGELLLRQLDRGEVTIQDVSDNVKRLDATYLAIDALRRVEIE